MVPINKLVVWNAMRPNYFNFKKKKLIYIIYNTLAMNKRSGHMLSRRGYGECMHMYLAYHIILC